MLFLRTLAVRKIDFNFIKDCVNLFHDETLLRIFWQKSIFLNKKTKKDGIWYTVHVISLITWNSLTLHEKIYCSIKINGKLF